MLCILVHHSKISNLFWYFNTEKKLFLTAAEAEKSKIKTQTGFLYPEGCSQLPPWWLDTAPPRGKEHCHHIAEETVWPKWQ